MEKEYTKKELAGFVGFLYEQTTKVSLTKAEHDNCLKLAQVLVLQFQEEAKEKPNGRGSKKKGL